jgi:uncharacterized tellurite resistance protein B-like protein
MVERMDTQSRSRLLLKILIGVAWLDGEIQPQERQYLAKVAQTHHQDRDADIDSLLTGNLQVTATDCEHWIQAYLGDRSIYDDDLLIEAISGLIYSDGDVAISEAKLLADIQSSPATTPPTKLPLIAKIQQLYRSWLQKV